MRKIFAFAIFFFVFFGVISFIYKTSSRSWSTYTSFGGITGQLFKKGSTLIFGTTYTTLDFLDTQDQTKSTSLDFNIGNVSPQVVYGNKLLVISGDTLRMFDINSKKTMWQVSEDGQFNFQRAVINKGMVYASALDGSLSVFDDSNGKFMWRFTPGHVTTLSSILSKGNLNYFGDFIVADNRVYIASRDYTFYALNSRTGFETWKTDIGDLVTYGPEHYGRYLYVSTRSGGTIALDRYSGKIIWKTSSDSPVVCSRIMTAFGASNIPQLQLLATFNESLRNWITIGPLAYFELHEDGTLIRRDGKTGKIIWESESLGAGVNCPVFWKSSAILSNVHGKLTVISLNTGKKVWEKTNLGTILQSAIVLPKLVGLIPDWLNVFTPGYLLSNTTGDLWLINGSTGKIYWKFIAQAPTYFSTKPFIDGKYIYYPTAIGVIYKLNKHTGLPDLNSGDRQFEVSQISNNVGGNQIFELTLKSEGVFINPWAEADLTAVFTNASGKTITVPGFYYDQNLWKVRFNPPLKGYWKWEMFWSPHGKTLTKFGNLYSSTDTSDFYLRADAKNPQRLTLDGETVFNGIGLGDQIYDNNHDGSPFDDWAIGNSTHLVATDSAGLTTTFRSDAVVSLGDYINTYGPSGAGFNIFRWNPNNAAPSLWRDFMYPITYSITDGKGGDTLVKELRNNGIHVWFTLFGYNIPYSDSKNPNDRFLLTSYVRYVIARYGAYVDIWELANELSVPADIAKLLKDEINTLDYEHRLVSISSKDYNFDQTDVVAPHWYESEDITQSDIKTAQTIKKLDVHNKPIVIAEQGNQDANFDTSSAIRMRIRAWTAFFEQGILMFWNESSTKDYRAGVYTTCCFQANLYLGEHERAYINVLQKYTQGFPLKSKKVEYPLDRFGVRGYGLTSDTVNAAYFYHYANPFLPTSFSMILNTKKGGKFQWIDPGNGNIIQTGYCPPLECLAVSPVFKTDIYLHVEP